MTGILGIRARATEGVDPTVLANLQPPSLIYDTDGRMATMLTPLALNEGCTNPKALCDARITILEANRDSVNKDKNGACCQSTFAVVGGIAIALFVPIAGLLTVPAGLIVGGKRGHDSGNLAMKAFWLQAEIDAEKAFIVQHPDQLRNDVARQRFVREYIFNLDPGVTLRNYGRGDDYRWEANYHIYPEAFAVYNARAHIKPVLQSPSYD